ncbi:MAG: efflux RND transporter permease subunit [Calditrichia bacterium]|nr:efflux RND transporter permease subunit [Calditrichia bacterium]
MSDKRPGLLPNFSIHRPITVLMSLLALLVVGYIAFTQISVELMPEGFTPPFLGVWVPYPNSNPREVEEQVAKPVEEQVRTISGVDNVNTNSSSNGCWTWIEFVQDTDMDVAYTMLRDRMDRVKSELPDDIERIFVRKWSNDDSPIMWITLVQTAQYEDPFYLVEQHVKKPLERVDGVANIEIWGAEEKEILIMINQDRVRLYKINLYEIIQKLRNDNFAISSGFVNEGEQKIFVRSMGKFQSLEEIRNLPIRGANLRLKDIAEVKYDVPERRWRQVIDGKKSISIGVFKESMANTVALTDEVVKVFEERIKRDPLLAGFHVEVLFNQGAFIKESLDNLKNAALWGGFFAFAVLYFFLRRFRMTLIISLAIPLSILITLATMYFIGWTLNLITMMGLMVSVGMVVDNSIVVLENIYSKRAEGKDNKSSALWGSSEVALAVTMATLTTVVVFLPLILMNDNVGFRFYMLRIGLPVMISLIASLFVAMVFIPLAATRVVSKRKVQESLAIRKTNTLYQRVLSWTLRHKLETSIILIIVIMSMFYASGQTESTDRMQGNINDIRLFFDLPENLTIEDVEKIFLVVEDTVRKKSDVYNIRTISNRYSHNRGRMRIFLHPPEKMQWYEAFYNNVTKSLGIRTDGIMEHSEVLEDLKKRLPEFPGVDIRTNWFREGGDESSLEISLYGDDTENLAELSKEVERRLRTIDEIVSLETDREKGKNEIHLHIKRDQAKKFGISPQVISGTIQYALRGIPLPKYQTEEKEIDVRIQLREDDRRNLNQLKNLTFFSENGREIPLDAVADFTIQKGYGEIHRENGKTFLSVKANLSKETMGAVYAKVDQVMEGFEMPYGYSWSKGRRFHDMQESDDSQMFAIILAITFVFLLMGFLFESFVLPLSVIISIPFSFFGAFWLMYLTGTPIDLMSRIGFIILIGIVVNNAIVLIDLVNRLRKEGYSRFDAIMEAGRQRFRPILMTAFTTIGGLIPMAVGNAQMIGIPYAPMGRTIIGGLLTSTVLSLIAVPWAYVLFDDLRNYFSKITALYLRKEKTEAEPAAVISGSTGGGSSQ